MTVKESEGQLGRGRGGGGGGGYSNLHLTGKSLQTFAVTECLPFEIIIRINNSRDTPTAENDFMPSSVRDCL